MECCGYAHAAHLLVLFPFGNQRDGTAPDVPPMSLALTDHDEADEVDDEFSYALSSQIASRLVEGRFAFFYHAPMTCTAAQIAGDPDRWIHSRCDGAHASAGARRARADREFAERSAGLGVVDRHSVATTLGAPAARNRARR